ncbi:MAG: hypothetical protein IJ196_04550 [Prevotella sp.]|nr:hypothetical protein [Prevotella sp.]
MSEDNGHIFKIADHYVKIVFKGNSCNSMQLLPSFRPFESPETISNKELFFQLTVDDSTAPIPKSERERIRIFDTGNGKTSVDQLKDGGYQYIIKNLNEADCCLLIANKDFTDCHCALNGNYVMRSFGLNNALMLIYAFAGSLHDTLLIHASLVRHQGRGYAFTAKSGTGKSTHVSLWLRHIPDCDLMNDDNPIIRIIDGKPFIYGSPWSGKTPCYRNIKAPLGAISRIDRAKKNSIEKLSPVDSFATVLPSCSAMKWDETLFSHICDTVTRVVETTNVYTLHCLPDKEAAIICHQELTKQR